MGTGFDFGLDIGSVSYFEVIDSVVDIGVVLEVKFKEIGTVFPFSVSKSPVLQPHRLLGLQTTIPLI